MAEAKKKTTTKKKAPERFPITERGPYFEVGGKTFTSKENAQAHQKMLKANS